MKWSWRGAVALVLAACIGVGYAAALVLVVLEERKLTGMGAALLYITTGTLLGGVLSWLSGNRRRDRDDDE